MESADIRRLKYKIEIDGKELSEIKKAIAERMVDTLINDGLILFTEQDGFIWGEINVEVPIDFFNSKV